MIKNPPANAGDIRDAGSNPGLRRSPGGGQPIAVFLPVRSEDPGRLQSMGSCDVKRCGMHAGTNPHMYI